MSTIPFHYGTDWNVGKFSRRLAAAVSAKDIEGTPNAEWDKPMKLESTCNQLPSQSL
jgi:hypothetical protein